MAHAVGATAKLSVHHSKQHPISRHRHFHPRLDRVIVLTTQFVNSRYRVAHVFCMALKADKAD